MPNADAAGAAAQQHAEDLSMDISNEEVEAVVLAEATMAQAQRQHQDSVAATLNPVPTAASTAVHPTPAQEAPDEERIPVPSPWSASSTSFLPAGEMGGGAAVQPAPQPDPVVRHLDNANANANSSTYPRLPSVSALQGTPALRQPSSMGIVAGTALDGHDSPLSGSPYFTADPAMEGPTGFPRLTDRSPFTNGFMGAFNNPFTRGMASREATAPSARAFAYPPTPAPPTAAIFASTSIMSTWNGIPHGIPHDIPLSPSATSEGILPHGSLPWGESSFSCPSHASLSNVVDLEAAGAYRPNRMMSEMGEHNHSGARPALRHVAPFPSGTTFAGRTHDASVRISVGLDRGSTMESQGHMVQWITTLPGQVSGTSSSLVSRATMIPPGTPPPGTLPPGTLPPGTAMR